MALSDDQLHAVYLTRIIALSISLTGDLFVILVYARFKAIRVFTFKLVLYLALTDVFRCIGFFMPDNGVICQIVAFTTQVLGNAGALWIAIITWCLYQIVVNHYYEIHEHEPMFHLIVWSLSIVTGIIPFAFNSYGFAAGWCWIRVDTDDPIIGQSLRFFTFYFVQWCVIFYSCFVMYKIQRQNKIEGYRDHIGKELIRRLKYYPMILILVRVFPTVNRLYQYIVGAPVFWLVMLHIIVMGLSGLGYALVFILSKAVRHRVRYYFSKNAEDHVEPALIINPNSPPKN